MLDRIKKLIYVIYPSGLGGEFLSYIISNSIVNCNRNFANLNLELTGAWQGSCLFHFFADVKGDDNFINRQYIDNFNPDFSKWVVCKDHHRDILYEFLLKNFPNVKIIILMPDGPDEYFAKLCVHKTGILLDATEENLQKFLSLSYKELTSSEPTTKHWDHNTTKQLIDYRLYYKKLREVYFSSKQWWRPELYDLISSILNGSKYLQHDPDLNNLIYHRKQEFIKDIIHLQKYIDNFDTLVIPGNCYKESTEQFFVYLASKFNINPSQQIINKFQSWIDSNNKYLLKENNCMRCISYNFKINIQELRKDIYLSLKNKESNILFNSSLQEDLYYIKFTDTYKTKLTEIIDINFDIDNLILFSSTFYPNMVFEYENETYTFHRNIFDLIVFEKNATIKIQRDSFNEINPVFFGLQKVSKDSNFNFVKHDFVKQPKKIYRSSDYLHTKPAFVNDNFIVLNKNSSNTIIVNCDGGVMAMEEAYNLYFHPYIERIADNANTNIIGMRYADPTNFSFKHALTGYKPSTYTKNQTTVYIKNLINEYLPTTEKLISLGYCIGTYQAAMIANELKTDKLLLYDRIVSKLNSNSIPGFFENEEHVPSENVITSNTHSDITLFLLDDKNDPLMYGQSVGNNSSISHISNNITIKMIDIDYFEKFKYKGISNMLELALIKSNIALNDYI